MPSGLTCVRGGRVDISAAESMARGRSVAAKQKES